VITKESLFENGIIIIKTLKENNFEAFFVGGCVRDFLLDKTPNDIDITTNAKPYEIKKIFENTIPTGEKYGTMTVVINDQHIEVTTYRTDVGILDSRHPKRVEYSSKVVEDVKRRDFTVNGMIMDENFEIIDFVGGKLDLEKKIIRTIGNPNLRFDEDLLRILRAFYFQAKLDFYIHNDTLSAINEKSVNITNISKERILQEMIKILKSPYYKKALITMGKSQIRNYLPGLKLGLEYLSTLFDTDYHKLDVKVDVFFTICFILNGSVDNFYGFSNRNLNLYENAVIVATNKSYLDPLTLFKYGLEIPTLAARCNAILKKDRLVIKEIEKVYEDLPIKALCDLKINGNIILNVTDKKMGAWVGKLINEIAYKVIKKELPNNKEVLIKYIKDNVK